VSPSSLDLAAGLRTSNVRPTGTIVLSISVREMGALKRKLQIALQCERDVPFFVLSKCDIVVSNKLNVRPEPDLPR
jgi:hypothetical protein